MRIFSAGLVLLVGSLVVCSSPQGEQGFPNPQSGSGSGGGGGGSGSGGAGSGSSGGSGSGGSGGNLLGGSSSGSNPSPGPTTSDGGIACIKNPAQYDVPGNNCDDDDDGT